MNIMQNENNNQYFYCYNPSLRKHLGLSGLRWMDRGYNEKTKTYYWRFIQSDKLGELIIEYKNARTSKV